MKACIKNGPEEELNGTRVPTVINNTLLGANPSFTTKQNMYQEQTANLIIKLAYYMLKHYRP